MIRIPTSRRFLAVALTGLGLAGTGISSLAILTDTLTVTTDMSVLTIDLTAAAGAQSVEYDIVFTDEVEGEVLVLRNSGNGELRYAMTSAATGSLTSKISTAITAPANGTCPADPGTVVADPLTLALSLNGVSFGSSDPGQQAGDRILAPGSAHTLCLYWKPNAALLATDSASQTLTFHAEQTAGNP